MKYIWWFVFIFGFIFLVVSLFGYYLSWQVQTDPRQEQFSKGIVPEKLPDGFYKGSIEEIKTPWQGKRFDSVSRTGVNIWGNKQEEKYSFDFYPAKGLQDKNTEVIRLDYDISANPFWLRFVVDEIVQTKPGVFLGKAHLLLIPGFPFSLGYFSLEK